MGHQFESESLISDMMMMMWSGWWCGIIDGINSFHSRAEITYLVGNKNYWGNGVGFFAVSEIIKISKNFYKLNKLFAGIAENNIASRKVLEKNGFSLEGKKFDHLFYNGEFHNQLDFGLIL